MYWIIDIGNTAIKGGFVAEGELKDTFRIASSQRASASAYRHTLATHLDDRTVERTGIVSVVPTIADKIARAVRYLTMLEPEVLKPAADDGLGMAYKTPETLGSDRWAAAVGAWNLFGSRDTSNNRPVIVVDAGTAVNFEVVDSGGTYRGGAIAPGPALQIKALARGTAQLPEITIRVPKKPIGRSTRTALQSGITLGLIDQVAGMIKRITSQLGEEPFVVSTGGLGSFLKENISEINTCEPNLVLIGAWEMMKRR